MVDDEATEGGDPTDPVGFDVDAVLAAAKEAVGDDRVLLCVAFDDADFRTVYVDERVDALYADDEQRREHFGQIHSYVHLDFTERDLFEDLFLQPDGIRAFVTYMGTLIAVRVVTETEGIFISLAPGTPVTELVDAVEAVIRR